MGCEKQKGARGGFPFVTGAVKSEVSEMGRSRLQERSQELSLGHVQSHQGFPLSLRVSSHTASGKKKCIANPKQGTPCPVVSS